MFRNIFGIFVKPLVMAALRAAKSRLLAALERAVDSAPQIPVEAKPEVKALLQTAVDNWHIAL